MPPSSTHPPHPPQAFTADALAHVLTEVPCWRLDAAGTGLVREYVFSDFVAAFEFMTQVALWAQTHNHHPEWHNVYNRLHITWTTHDAGGVSERDIDMARRCDALWATASAQDVSGSRFPKGRPFNALAIPKAPQQPRA